MLDNLIMIIQTTFALIEFIHHATNILYFNNKTNFCAEQSEKQTRYGNKLRYPAW